MAKRGRKPKAHHLRLVDGSRNVTRHGTEDDLRKAVDRATAAFGRPEMPRDLKGQARAAWKRYIEPASWLDGSRGAAAIAFCELWRELRLSPTRFPAAKHGQMRGYMSDLGLTNAGVRAVAKQEPFDEFFDE